MSIFGCELHLKQSERYCKFLNKVPIVVKLMTLRGFL